MGKFLDLSGQMFGKWLVIQRVFKTKNRTHWLCQCSCGCHSLVDSSHLNNGRSTKCKKCHGKEAVKKRPLKHGQARHGIKSREYSCWSSMRTRCNNSCHEHWKYYGERGIKVCERWNEFENFLNDMGKCPDRHTLDRVNVNGDYSPENCRWATPKQQGENKRNNVKFERDGIIKTKTQWAKDYGIPYTSFSRLIKKLGCPLPKPPETK